MCRPLSYESFFILQQLKCISTVYFLNQALCRAVLDSKMGHQKSRYKPLHLYWFWSNNVTEIAYFTTMKTNTSCRKLVSSCKVVFTTLSACGVNVGLNPLVHWMLCQRGIKWHGCLAIRQLPGTSHVSLSQRVWWRFRWQVGSLGGVSTAFYKVVLQPWWHS